MSRKPRIDYKILNSTGEKVYKKLENSEVESDESSVKELSTLLTNLTFSDENMAVSNIDDIMKLKIEELTIVEDIEDFIDENNITEIRNSIEDIDEAVQKMEQFRTKLRCKHKELQAMIGDEYEKSYTSKFLEQIANIKLYITEAKNAKRSLRNKEHWREKEMQEIKVRKFNFTINDVRSVLHNLETEFSGELAEMSDEEIKRRKENVKSNIKAVDNLSNKINLMLEEAPADNEDVFRITQQYESLQNAKSRYCEELQQEIDQRELEKQHQFNKSLLNIKLPKFKGFNSTMDIYTFQNNFEKLHLSRSPKIMLPDLLQQFKQLPR